MRNKKRAYLIIEIMMVIIILAVLFCLYSLKEKYDQVDAEYRTLADAALVRPGNTEEEGQAVFSPYPLNWEAIHEINENIVAWIIFPKDGDFSVINYPIVHARTEEENDYYLRHTPEGEYLFAGSIFTSSWENGTFCRDQAAEERAVGTNADTGENAAQTVETETPIDDNTIIYGHAMNNGSMFGLLKQMLLQEVAEKNRFFYILTPEVREDGGIGKAYRYQVISAHEGTDASAYYTYAFGEDMTREEYLDLIRCNSAVDLPMPEGGGHLVTLSTCNNRTASGRRLVHAMEVEEVTDYTALAKEWEGR